MRVRVWILLAVLLALPLTAHAQTEAVLSFGRFAFEDGVSGYTIRDMVRRSMR